MLARFFAFLAGASLIGSYAAAEVRQPTGAWSVGITGNECLLTRPYGNAKQPLFLAFSKAPMSSGLDMVVLRPSTNADLRHGPAFVRPDAQPAIDRKFYASLLRVNPSTGLKVNTMRRIWIGVPDDAYAALKSAQQLSVDADKEVKEQFLLGDFPEALRRLDECTVRLGEKWGYPGEEQHRISTPAKPVEGLDNLFSGDDYPRAALRDETMGRVRVKIPVSATGQATDCQIVAGSGSVDLDAATCRIILSRAKFEPAIDVDGKAVRSVYVETIQWLLI